MSSCFAPSLVPRPRGGCSLVRVATATPSRSHTSHQESPLAHLGARQSAVAPRDVLEVRDRDIATQLVQQSDVDPAHADALVEALVAGTHVAIRVETRDRLLDAPKVRPLVEPTKPVIDDDARPTWISLEVTHAAELSLEGVEVYVSAADGRERFGRLGPDGRWRSDDLPRGTCSVTLLDHEALRVRTRVVGVPATAEGRVAWELGKTRALELPATAHHRIHVIMPRAFRFSV